MSWINDVKHEINKLDYSITSLKKFGFTIGIILSLIAIWFLINKIFIEISYGIVVLVIILFLISTFAPKALRKFFTIWMGLAFVMGWFVSRILITFIFLFLITPIGFLTKILNKKFLQLSFKNKNNSYWIKKSTEEIKYDKMY